MTNQVADEESRTTTDRLDWKLSLEVFQRINAIWGPLEVDLRICLAPLLSTEPVLQLETGSTGRSNRCFSSRLEASEGLCQPSPVLSRESSETSVKAQQARVILVAPIWKGQPWYPVLLEMLWDFPRWIPLSQDLFLMTSETVAMSYRPQLAVWPISRENLPVKTFQAELGISCWLPGEQTESNKTYDSHFKKWLCWCSACKGFRSRFWTCE